MRNASGTCQFGPEPRSAAVNTNQSSGIGPGSESGKSSSNPKIRYVVVKKKSSQFL